MTRKRMPTKPSPERVHLERLSEHDRLAMIMMQLDMALAMAREKGLPEVQRYLEAALANARSVRDSKLN